MNYKEKKRSMFFGLPWTFTSYTVTEEIITVDTGLFKKEENDCYLYKVIDVRLESTLLERMLGLGTIGSETAPHQTRKRDQRLHFKTVRAGKNEKKNRKYAASGWQSGDEPDGRKRQLQIARKVKAVLIKTALPFWWLFLPTA